MIEMRQQYVYDLIIKYYDDGFNAQTLIHIINKI